MLASAQSKILLEALAVRQREPSDGGLALRWGKQQQIRVDATKSDTTKDDCIASDGKDESVQNAAIPMDSRSLRYSAR